jgi:hypothetical protein
METPINKSKLELTKGFIYDKYQARETLLWWFSRNYYTAVYIA